MKKIKEKNASYLNFLDSSIVIEMLNEQEKQGRKKNIDVFIASLSNGFEWKSSKRGYEYWYNILVQGYSKWDKMSYNVIYVNILLI